MNDSMFAELAAALSRRIAADVRAPHTVEHSTMDPALGRAVSRGAVAASPDGPGTIAASPLGPVSRGAVAASPDGPGTIAASPLSPVSRGAVAASPDGPGTIAASPLGPVSRGAVASSDAPATTSNLPFTNDAFEKWIGGHRGASGARIIKAIEEVGVDKLADAIYEASKSNRIDLGSHTAVAEALGKDLARTLARSTTTGGRPLQLRPD